MQAVWGDDIALAVPLLVTYQTQLDTISSQSKFFSSFKITLLLKKHDRTHAKSMCYIMCKYEECKNIFSIFK